MFTEHDYPEGGRGPAAFWLPLLALFNGARQAELASLTAADVQTEPESSTPLLYITAQASRGKKLKTKASQRVVPIHTQLVMLGFLKFVEHVRKRDGDKAFLIFRGTAHGADNVSNREPLQVGKTVGAAYLICNASPRRAAS